MLLMVALAALGALGAGSAVVLADDGGSRSG
jgi:hypothetical protein